ncbi:MAG: hypothetical protein HRT45_13810 [Bdellovibrionales bacterium]|nr:hypothetical protein [Bdellovibrionales bacterium]
MRHLITMRAFKTLPLVAALLLVTTLFQNCGLRFPSTSSPASKIVGSTKESVSPVKDDSGTNTSLTSNNGEGYDGKLYYETDVENQCPNSDVKSIIERKSDGSFVQVVENCLQIAPKPLDQTTVGFETYNTEVVIFNNRPLFPRNFLNKYDGVTLDRRIFCRKSQPLGPRLDVRVFADVYIDISQIQTQPPVSSAILGRAEISTGEILTTINYEESNVFLNQAQGDPGFTQTAFGFNYWGPGVEPDPFGNPLYRVVFSTVDRVNFFQSYLLIFDQRLTLANQPVIQMTNLDCWNY